MKSKIDKSKLMKRAWEFCRRHYKGDRKKFGKALRYAWIDAKRDASENRKTMVYSESFAAGLLKYYESGSNGRRYYGD